MIAITVNDEIIEEKNLWQLISDNTLLLFDADRFVRVKFDEAIFYETGTNNNIKIK